MPPRLTALVSKEEILHASGHDMLLECDLPDDYRGPAYAWGDAVATTRVAPHLRRASLLLVGPSRDVGALATALVHDGVLRELALRVVTMPRDALAQVSRTLRLFRGDDWDWMWTRAAPPTQADEGRLVNLTESDRADLSAFLREHNPRTYGAPFARPHQTWVGRRDPRVAAHSGVVACGSVEPGDGGRPFLAGITVAPAARGHGLGAAVSAALTRVALAQHDVSTLGLYADNDIARRLYTRLGYRCDHRLSTRLLEVSGEEPRQPVRA